MRPDHRVSRRSRALALIVGAALLPGLLFVSTTPALADTGDAHKVPDWVAGASSANRAQVLAPSLRGASGTVTVSVQLSEKPIAAAVAADAVATRTLPSKKTQQARTNAVRAQQSTFTAAARKLGARPLGNATRAVNAVVVAVPAKQLTALAELSGVVSIKPVAKYQTFDDPAASGSLAQAADYLEASSVRRAGIDGTGVRIAVLDSGIDYTHANLGGPGTTAAYQQCFAQATQAPTGECATLFGPDAPKVKGGYDFVGETWPNTDATTPDPNPIDAQGHGTHVSDIAAGRSADGTHLGIAPGASLYAVKVCSSVATSCNGVAILEGLDWAMDPNGDGDISDAVDIVNLSLGASYGQAEDDSSVAIDNIVRAGVVAVIAAGNSGDRPFIVGSPSTAERAISVAQTALPDDMLYTVAVDAPVIAGLPDNMIKNSKLQSWTPAPKGVVSGRLAVPSGSGEGCTADTFANFPAGAIALIARGTCNASLKSQLAQAAGATAVILYNNVPGDPPDFSFGGGADVTIPTFTIAQDKGQLLAAAVAAGPVSITIDPAATTSLRNTVVGTSSRGIAIAGTRAKPDIGAPGAWLSAEVGTGSEETSFGGTSGATPVITGAAALVLQKHPDLTPLEVKARLVGTASLDDKTPDSDANLYATPISRIGGGEVRIAPAVNATGELINPSNAGGSIGLGIPRLTKKASYTRTLQLVNPTSAARNYTITATFRDPGDQRSGAVTIDTPSSVYVPAHTTRSFNVGFTVDPSRLAAWPFTHAAGYDGDGATLNGPEFDGYVLAATAGERLHVGWTVLPHRSADVSAGKVRLDKQNRGTVTLRNASGVSDGGVDVFGLTGTSPRQAAPRPGQPGSPGSNVALIDLAAAGVRDGDGVVQFAVATFDRRVSPLYPGGFEIDVDTNRDGTADYAVFQQEAVGFGSSGQSLVYVMDLATQKASAFYYLDADFDSTTRVFTVPLDALGLSVGDTFDFTVFAYDDYFSGNLTDQIADQTWTVGQARYVASAGDQLTVPAGRSLSTRVTRASGVTSSSTGLLLLYGDGVTNGFQAVSVTGGRGN